MKSHLIIPLALLGALLLCSGFNLRVSSDDSPFGDDAWKRIVRLSGDWKFSVGDSADWAAPEFSDRDWATIHAPAEWQSEGYRDYNGYAWYRKTFSFPAGHEKEAVFLSLGRIDDAGQVYLNGKLIGTSGEFPPHYLSAYDKTTVFEVPSGSLLVGRDNVLAVRVYDGGGVGGMVDGRLGFFTTDIPQPEVVLNGTWKFMPGDNAEWKQEHCSESGFADIPVPSLWQNAGYPQLHGYAWYRKTFTVSTAPADKTLVLMLGKIDDFDAVYLNGTLVGSTGPVEQPARDDGVGYYAQNRNYFFPASLLKETNTIAVRVYDRGGVGGIYSSPLGIISQTAFIKYWDERKKHTHSIWRLFESD
jgi:Beta-galactosidase jelly roll domain